MVRGVPSREFVIVLHFVLIEVEQSNTLMQSEREGERAEETFPLWLSHLKIYCKGFFSPYFVVMANLL